MDLVYQEYFGFTQPPFNITPDPGFLYSSTCHREGLAQLCYGIKARKGFIVLTGEVGTGKTTLIHALLKDLDGAAHTALVFSAIMTPMDLLRYVCDDFGLTDPKTSLGDIHDYLVLLNEYLLEKYKNGENCALIIDEAQNLSNQVLESIRLLSNFETSKDKLLQILLVGQPELSVRLNSQELRQLKQRVALRHHLRSLTLKECEGYIINRLRMADGHSEIFTPSAIETVYEYSKGIPRIINVLSDNALLSAYALEKKRVDEVIVTEVAADLSLAKSSFHPRQSYPVPLARINGAPHKSLEKMVEVSPPAYAQPVKRVGMVSPSTIVDQDSRVTDKFFQDLAAVLIDAMGPMASIVLQDNIRRLGQSPVDFPRKKLSVLIESISSEILEPSLRQSFCRTAFERVKDLLGEA